MGLRYAFDIQGDAAVYEVGVDADKGRALETAPKTLIGMDWSRRDGER